VAALYFAMVSLSTSVSILLAPLDLLLAFCITFLRSESARNPHVRDDSWCSFGESQPAAFGGVTCGQG
jgi:hypothetical protein